MRKSGVKLVISALLDFLPISTSTPNIFHQFKTSFVHMQKLAPTFSFASRHIPTPPQLTSVLPITDLIVATYIRGTVEEIDYLREYTEYYQVPIFIHGHLLQGTDSSRSYS